VSAPRVVVADDHALVRAAVRNVLEREGFEVCGVAADAAEAVSVARETRPDVCLLDIHMPGSGIAAAAELRRVLPEAEIVMLTVSDGEDDLIAALGAGASGYVLKADDESVLVDSLRRVLNGEAVVPPPLLAHVLRELRGRRGRRVMLRRGTRASLTEREWAVLEFLREGLSTAQIAQRLYVTPATVRSHVSAVLAKLEVADRSQAVRLLEESNDRAERDTTIGQ
jgi:DNA-binding NarL/FixJ family response regulator